MSARDSFRALFGTLDEASEADLDRRLDAHRDEVLAADGQAYDGELAMLRGLVRTLRTVVRYGASAEAQRAEVQRLLAEHERDEQDAYAGLGEKATASATATPDFCQVGRTYSDPSADNDWKFRVDTITTHPEDGERTALGWRHFRGEWTEQAYGEDDFEIHLLAGMTDGGDR